MINVRTIIPAALSRVLALVRSRMRFLATDGIRNGAFIAFVACVVIATTLPSLYALSLKDTVCTYPSRFNWFLPRGDYDFLSYLSWSKQAELGEYLFLLKLTSVQNPRLIFQPVFLAAGKLAALTGIRTEIILFVIFRIGFIIALLLFLRWFLTLFPLTVKQKWTALFLICFSSGLGWIYSLRGALKILDIAGGFNTYVSMMMNPIPVCSFCMMICIIGSIMKATASPTEKGKRNWSIAAGAITGMLVFIHPYDVLPMVMMAIIVTLLRTPVGIKKELLFYCMIALPPVIVQYLIYSNDPALLAHGKNAWGPIEPIGHVFLALGIPFLFAAYGVYALKRRKDMVPYMPLVVWIAVHLVAFYLPVWFKGQMILGITIPLGILAAVGVDKALTLVREKIRLPYAALFTLVFLCTLPSQVVALRYSFFFLKKNPFHYFIPLTTLEACEYLRNNSKPEDIVFADYKTSAYIPAMSGNTVLVGHFAQSVDLDDQYAWYSKLFSYGTNAISEEEKIALMQQSPVKFILVDPNLTAHWLRKNNFRWILRCGPVVFKNYAVAIIQIDR